MVRLFYNKIIIIFAYDMRKLSIYIVSFFILSLFGGCNRDKDQMLRQLEQLEQKNAKQNSMENDSLAEVLVDYFDCYGSANEKMRARYILGRTYFDLGELPRALEIFYTARDCADSSATDCDYKVLSRIHAQSARVLKLQIQPRSQLNELQEAVRCAYLAKDTIQAIECYAQQGDCYRQLRLVDSLVGITEESARRYREIGYDNRASAKLSFLISPALQIGDLERAKHYIDLFESSSALFDEKGDIVKGREIYYYVKGRYYLQTNKLDSAEQLFRKELQYGKDLNNQIAGSKGLQELYTKKMVSDSIAKYASIGYELNDSAYLLSEMENIQRMTASYNYQHNKELAQKKQQDAKRAYWVVAFMVVLVVTVTLAALYLFTIYKRKKEQELKRFLLIMRNLESSKTELEMLRSLEQQASEEQIKALKVEIVQLQNQVDASYHLYERQITLLEKTIDNNKFIMELHSKANSSFSQSATAEELNKLSNIMDELIPTFYATLHAPSRPIRKVEYQVCVLIRFHFKSTEISKLTGTSDGYIANLKKRIYRKVFNQEGTARQLDAWIMNIR